MDVLVNSGPGRAIDAELTAISGLPALFQPTAAAAGRPLESFTANMRNPHTRRADARAAAAFAVWCKQQGLKELAALRPVHVAAYIEQLQERLSAPSVKQHLTALRVLFDWIVVGQVIPFNPASSMHGPRHSVRKGKLPSLPPKRRGRCSTPSTSPRHSACAITP